MVERSDSDVCTAGGPDYDFGWALSTLLRAYLKLAEAEVSEIPGGPRAYQVLSLVASGSCRSQAALADRLGIDRTVMTYLLDALEAQDLVRRAPDPGDRRARIVTPTEKGSALLAKMADRIRHIERRLLSSFSDAEAEAIRASLLQAARHADGGTGPEPTCEIPTCAESPLEVHGQPQSGAEHS